MSDQDQRTQAKPKKLRNGDWGCVVDGTVNPGEIVTINTSTGKSWPVVIEKVIWTDGTTSICSTREREAADKEREQPAGDAAATQDLDASAPADDGAAPPPLPSIDDEALDAIAEAEASTQAQRDDDVRDVMALAHAFSFARDF